jgi:hypothetical protein
MRACAPEAHSRPPHSGPTSGKPRRGRHVALKFGAPLEARLRPSTRDRPRDRTAARVQACARWPLTQPARGTKNALLGRLRRPPGAGMGLSTSQRMGFSPAGYRRLDFAISGLPASPLRRGSAALPPQLEAGGWPGCAGAWMVCPPASRRTALRPPRLLRFNNCTSPDGPHHKSAYTMTENAQSPPGRNVLASAGWAAASGNAPPGGPTARLNSKLG